MNCPRLSRRRKNLSRFAKGGYFLPGEDEQLRQLTVSCWQARCALIEVVTSLYLEALQNEDCREVEQQTR